MAQPTRPTFPWGGRFLSAVALSLIAALTALAELDPPGPDGHRALRDNPPREPVSPQPLQSFAGYPDAPDVTVVPREGELSHYPCADCHAHMPANPERRELYAPHPATLDHGDGRFWCLDCHDAGERNVLGTLAGESIGFDRADRVCAQCHYAVHRDWTFGAHGKRVADWQGGREIYGCAHCHDPHSPALRPRAPEGPPGIRAGLKAMPDGDGHFRVFPWQSMGEEVTRDAQENQP
jgi:hypothetical protein